MSKQDKLDSVPPFIPILWQDWESNPDTLSMTELQVGIFYKALLRQWQIRTLPRSAWDFKRVVGLKCSYQTTLNFLTIYSHLFVCCECGRRWTKVNCECGKSQGKERVENRKLKYLRIDVNSGLGLGTTEQKRTELESNAIQANSAKSAVAHGK